MTSFSDMVIEKCGRIRQRIVFTITVISGSCNALVYRKTMPCRREQKGMGKFNFAQKCLLKNMSSCNKRTRSGTASCAQGVIDICCRRSTVVLT